MQTAFSPARVPLPPCRSPGCTALAPRGWQPQDRAAALPGTDQPAAWGRAAGAVGAAAGAAGEDGRPRPPEAERLRQALL